MKTIKEFTIPCLYTAYAIDLGQGYDESGERCVRRLQYHCKKCGNNFTADHRRHWAYQFTDNIVYCPHCGQRHESWWNGPNSIGYARDTGTPMPLAVDLRLQEGKDVLYLRARIKTLIFVQTEETERHALAKGARTEEFRFNVRQRKTEFLAAGKGARAVRREIGSPLDNTVLLESLLTHIHSSNCSKEFHGGVAALMRTLRDRVRAKWRKIHGYDIGPLHVPGGQLYGKMLLPILNIAYRMVYTDAGRIPKEVLGGRRQSADGNHFLTMDARERFGRLDAIRQGKDTVSAVIGVFGLPDAPSVRRILSSDILMAGELMEAWKATGNVDHMTSLRKLMTGWPNKGDAYKTVGMLVRRYSTEGVLRYIRRSDCAEFADIGRMLRRLLPEREEAFWAEKPRLRELHDALVQALKHQKEEGFPLMPPEHIRRRLAMQIDQLHFYLPEHSTELRSIGDALHNCVRTYDDDMRAQKCAIVPVADDKGKLVACLEVRGDRLVQAKLKHNVPVKGNAELNGEVLKWAKCARLTVSTNDVDETPDAATGRVAV